MESTYQKFFNIGYFQNQKRDLPITYLKFEPSSALSFPTPTLGFLCVIEKKKLLKLIAITDNLSYLHFNSISFDDVELKAVRLKVYSPNKKDDPVNLIICVNWSKDCSSIDLINLAKKKLFISFKEKMHVVPNSLSISLNYLGYYTQDLVLKVHSFLNFTQVFLLDMKITSPEKACKLPVFSLSDHFIIYQEPALLPAKSKSKGKSKERTETAEGSKLKDLIAGGYKGFNVVRENVMSEYGTYKSFQNNKQDKMGGSPIICRHIESEQEHRIDIPMFSDGVSTIKFVDGSLKFLVSNKKSQYMFLIQLFPQFNLRNNQQKNIPLKTHRIEYRIYRGLTPSAVVDCSLSECKRYLAVSSLRGTCHLYYLPLIENEVFDNYSKFNLSSFESGNSYINEAIKVDAFQVAKVGLDDVLASSVLFASTKFITVKDLIGPAAKGDVDDEVTILSFVNAMSATICTTTIGLGSKDRGNIKLTEVKIDQMELNTEELNKKKRKNTSSTEIFRESKDQFFGSIPNYAYVASNPNFRFVSCDLYNPIVESGNFDMQDETGKRKRKFSGESESVSSSFGDLLGRATSYVPNSDEKFVHGLIMKRKHITRGYQNFTLSSQNSLNESFGTKKNLKYQTEEHVQNLQSEVLKATEKELKKKDLGDKNSKKKNLDKLKMNSESFS